ncbi:hypothetical protein K443DRAFT_5668 [Laccaria amethystina LaAM-08-1]|uniref:Uncharacterized protein n=1 Tax=Laccaria amethystina LaAM-08-1 TaxID=1095629 RepID=A0A0C9WUW0_9AGAR|nr:hypothetical protein K443DRAFT_5668 [Laccaria amethystina LaAM-08-1]
MLIKAAHDHRTKILQHPRTKTSITLPDSVQFHRQDHGRDPVITTQPLRDFTDAALAAHRLVRLAACGLVFPIAGGNRRQVVFSADDDLGGYHSLPKINVQHRFQNQAVGVVVHRARVTVGACRFLIYGYTKDGKQINRSLKIIRPSSEWCGELVVFQLGARVPFLSRFTARKRVVDIAVTVFMSRVTEAYDIGRSPPTRIEV